MFGRFECTHVHTCICQYEGFQKMMSFSLDFTVTAIFTKVLTQCCANASCFEVEVK